MKTNFTKGEWTKGTDTASKKWMQIFCNGKIIAEAKTLNKIGERKSTDFQEEEANAKLIAAAPELFEALIFCRSVIGESGLFERSEQLAFEMAEKVLNKVLS